MKLKLSQLLLFSITIFIATISYSYFRNNIQVFEWHSKNSIIKGTYRCQKRYIDQLNKYERDISSLEEQSEIFNKLSEERIKNCIANCLNKGKNSSQCAMDCGIETGMFQLSGKIGNLRKEYQTFLDTHCK